MSEHNIRTLAVALIITVVGSTLGIVGLASRVRDLEAQMTALVELQEAQVHTDEIMAKAITTNADTIDALNRSTSGLLHIIEANRIEHVKSVAEIYQGHIVPLRAFHMEDVNE